MISTHKFTSLRDSAEVAAAMNKLVKTVKALNLSQQEFEDLIAIDISAKLSGPHFNALTHFAAGLQSAWQSSIIQDHCEFIYTTEGGTKYASTYYSEWPHFSYMPASQMDSSTAAYYWKGTDAAFTASVVVGELS